MKYLILLFSTFALFVLACQSEKTYKKKNEKYIDKVQSFTSEKDSIVDNQILEGKDPLEKTNVNSSIEDTIVTPKNIEKDSLKIKKENLTKNRKNISSPNR